MRSCSLRVFTYPSLQEPLRALLQFIANETAKDRRHLPCDLDDESCKIDSFGLTARQYTADVPIRNALLNRCRIIANPDEADIFLVPYLYGVSSTITWGKYWHFSEREAIKNLRTKGMKLLSEGLTSLPHLTAVTARRHVILWTTDVQFVPHDGSKAAELVKNMTIVHLGDDLTPSRPDAKKSVLLPFRGSLTVPYRVSQWLPLDAPSARPFDERRLLLANVNPARHATRANLLKHLESRAATLGVQRDVLLADSTNASAMLEVGEAAEKTLASKFCLCPTGDSKGFTARFYYSIALGCIPVRFDGWQRNLTQNGGAAYPFAHRIDWSRVVVEADTTDELGSGLLDTLLAMPKDEVEARMRYVREVAPLLMYGGDGREDAPQMLIEQLQSSFGRRHT